MIWRKKKRDKRELMQQGEDSVRQTGLWHTHNRRDLETPTLTTSAKPNWSHAHLISLYLKTVQLKLQSIDLLSVNLESYKFLQIVIMS